MSRGYNRTVLMGNLARDPDVRFTPNKQKVARITHPRISVSAT